MSSGAVLELLTPSSSERVRTWRGVWRVDPGWSADLVVVGGVVCVVDVRCAVRAEARTSLFKCSPLAQRVRWSTLLEAPATAPTAPVSSTRRVRVCTAWLAASSQALVWHPGFSEDAWFAISGL